ncbi:MAG: ABC transporter substrate-binding protein [Prevotella sp.]|jgi:peptide/nickel transport system substrate-binding protein|nr:ABC transporter substrate-binding protein [Prevotella sp.]
MTKNRNLSFLLGIMGSFLFLMAACSKQDKGPSGDTTSSTAQVLSGGTKTLVYSLSNDLEHFDPFTNQTLTFIKTVGYNCYESLLHIGENMEYVPDLAISWEHPDPLTYIFKLRQGVKFHNGNFMTAEDVKFSFEHALNPETASWFAAFFSGISAIDVVDAETVRFSFSKISNTFLDNVAMLKIINKGTEAGLKQKPIGTGAFKFVQWLPNDNTTLERFDDYWDVGVVNLDKIVLKPLPDKRIQLTNLTSGTVNLVEDLPLSEIETVEGNANLQVLQSKSSNSTILIEVGRHNVPAFKDPRVMAALGHALDKEAINRSVYGNLAKVIWSPYPTGTKYYKNISGNAYDLEKAKELLTEAGFASGLTFDFYIATGFVEWEKIAVIYQADLRKIGVIMNIKKVEFSEWLDNYLNRTYHMIVNQYPMGGTDPAVYNNIILTQLEPYQLNDLPEISRLIKEGAEEGNDARRVEIYGRIQDLVFEYKPIISVVEAPLLYGASANLHGIVLNPVGHTFLKAAYFE